MKIKFLARTVWGIFAPPALLAAIGVVVGSKLVSSTTLASGFDSNLENSIKMSGQRVEASPDILIVRVTTKTKAYLGDPTPDGPVDRRAYAEFIELLDRAGARVLLSDIAFTTPKPEQDKILARAIRELKTLRCALSMSEPESAPNPQEPDQWAYRFAPHALEAYETGGNAAFCHALSSQPGDTISGVFPIRRDFESGRSLVHSAVAAAMLYLGSEPSKAKLELSRRKFVCDQHEISVTANSELPLQWTRSAGSFAGLTFENALEKLRRSENKLFKDKIVVLGDGRAVRSDWHLTDRMEREPGYEIVANAVNTVLLAGSKRTSSIPNWLQVSLCVAVTTLLGATILGFSGWKLIVGSLLLGTATLSAPSLFFGFFRIQTNPVVWLASLAVVTVGCFGLRILRSGAFDWRKSGDILDSTVMFIDIRESTPLAIKLGLLRFQRAYERLERRWNHIAVSNRGVVERSMGDGVLVVFSSGSPARDARNAIKSAGLAIVAACEAARDFGESVSVGIGIASGAVSGGYVVEGGRRVWSSTGEIVVIAQRLQALTRDLEKGAIIDANTSRLLSHEFQYVSLGSVSLKGIPTEQEVFELTGISLGPPDNQVQA